MKRKQEGETEKKNWVMEVTRQRGGERRGMKDGRGERGGAKRKEEGWRRGKKNKIWREGGVRERWESGREGGRERWNEGERVGRGAKRQRQTDRHKKAEWRNEGKTPKTNFGELELLRVQLSLSRIPRSGK